MSDPWDEIEATCQRCSGEGEVLVCIDDMCRGAGECFHGDGLDVCPSCNGAGYHMRCEDCDLWECVCAERRAARQLADDPAYMEREP